MGAGSPMIASVVGPFFAFQGELQLMDMDDDMPLKAAFSKALESFLFFVFVFHDQRFVAFECHFVFVILP